MNKITALGIDLAKNVFELHGVDEHGVCILRRQIRRAQVLRFFAQLPPCLVGMEACGGSHYWGREISKLGHQVKMMPPQYVKPFVRGQKTDRNDAQAICTAALQAQMPQVAVKSEEQQGLLALHRLRELLQKQRKQLGNQLRALLGEFGHVLPRGLAALRQGLPALIEALPQLVQAALREGYERLVELDRQERVHTRRLEQLAQADALCSRLMQERGLGALTASAFVATIGDPARYRNGRQLAASLGIVPRQHSSGGRVLLLGISKRGDRYLRTLLIHGARAVLRHVADKTDPLSRWLQQLIARRGMNRAAVALANKNARRLWAIWRSGEHLARV